MTLEHASESVNILRNDFSLRHLVFKAYEGLGHWWFAQEMQDVANWFGENVSCSSRSRRFTELIFPVSPFAPGS